MCSCDSVFLSLVAVSAACASVRACAWACPGAEAEPASVVAEEAAVDLACAPSFTDPGFAISPLVRERAFCADCWGRE
jgi:hypothetical protein